VSIRPPGFDYSPKRLLSPPFERKTKDLDEIQAKQEKAQEMRDLIVAAKLKKQSEKVFLPSKCSLKLPSIASVRKKSRLKSIENF
jgi:hypothetical protein